MEHGNHININDNDLCDCFSCTNRQTSNEDDTISLTFCDICESNRDTSIFADFPCKNHNICGDCWREKISKPKNKYCPVCKELLEAFKGKSGSGSTKPTKI